MDVTTLFKACVKTVKVTNKNLGVQQEPKLNSILKAPSKDVHLSKAKEVLKHVKSLQQFLMENKAAYLNVINYLSTNKIMSEVDREHVDEQAEKIISACTGMIHDYKKEIGQLPCSKQKKEHYQNVVESLESYLKVVSKIYTEAKAVRVKRVIDTHKLSKLETEHVGVKEPQIFRDFTNNSTIPEGDNLQTSLNSTSNYEEQLSPEDMQMFEEENEHLFNELNSISDEVKQMESKVVHIAELQEIFTEKVLQQDKDIERISETVVGSTENMKSANEQIRQAMQRNAGLRVWMLFFLLVMSFSLLFLDWYND